MRWRITSNPRYHINVQMTYIDGISSIMLWGGRHRLSRESSTWFPLSLMVLYSGTYHPWNTHKLRYDPHDPHSLPFAFLQAGLVFGTALLLVTAYFTIISVLMLTILARKLKAVWISIVWDGTVFHNGNDRQVLRILWRSFLGRISDDYSHFVYSSCCSSPLLDSWSSWNNLGNL